MASTGVVGFHLTPSVWVGATLPDPKAEVTLQELQTEVYRRDLAVGIRARVLHSGVFIFDFSAWPRNKDFPTQPKNWAEYDEAVSVVAPRVRIINAYLACLYSALQVVQDADQEKMIVSPIDLVPYTQFGPPPEGIHDLFVLGLTRRTQAGTFRLEIESNLRHTFQQNITEATLVKSFEMLEDLLGRGSEDALLLPEMLLRSRRAYEDLDYNLCLILAWAMTEKMLFFLWDRYIVANRTRILDGKYALRLRCPALVPRSRGRPPWRRSRHHRQAVPDRQTEGGGKPLSERLPSPPPRPEASLPDAAWNLDAISSTLAADAEPATDVAFGTGQRYRLGELQPVELEFYPERGVVRVTGGDVQLSLFRQTQGPRLAPEGLVFELPSPPPGRLLTVSPRGEVLLALAPPDPVARASDRQVPFLRPQDSRLSAEGPNTRLSPETLLPGDSVPSEKVVDAASPTPPGQPEPESQRIPRLTGRLGGPCRFHTTRSGTLVGEFDLAVKDPDDPTKTIWHRIVVFGARAEALRDGPAKGDLVDVLGGYRHIREVTGKDGRKRRREEVYATVVKLR